MSEKQTSGNPATLRDLVMSSSPLPRAANRFAAPAPPATAESCAGSHHSALTIGADLPGHDNHTLILTGRTETAVSNNKSPILGNGTAPHNQIAIPCKHVAVFVAALDRMVSISPVELFKLSTPLPIGKSACPHPLFCGRFQMTSSLIDHVFPVPLPRFAFGLRMLIQYF